METPNQRDVEFVGGPFDGHVYVGAGARQIAEYVAVPVNARTLSLLDGKGEGKKGAASSVAVYQLQRTGNGWRYLFVAVAPPQDFQLESWIG